MDMRGEPLRGPAFGSYGPDDVGWLLQDLSDRVPVVPVADREGALQRGESHYSETLPVEYRPSPEYRRAYDGLLASWAGPVATGIAVLGEMIARRRPDPVLVSLARAGTPIGVLLRRWFARRGVDAPHFAVSIIRDKGLDAAAMAWLVARFDPARIVFVDGWTGKGVIADELARALAALPGPARPDPTLAVVADPAGVTRLCSTRDDLLIPSACLNATVSGLVSRTVHSKALTPPGTFHGARFYRELTSDDVSGAFVATVESHFPRRVEPADPGPPTRAGRGAAERLAGLLGVTDLNLLKPGLGEATRVLLRRTPQRLVLRDPDADAVRHLVVLAAEKGVAISVDPDLPYAAVGVIRSVP